MPYYVKNKETGEKFIVLHSNDGYILASLRKRFLLKVTEEHFLKDFEFDGLID